MGKLVAQLRRKGRKVQIVFQIKVQHPSHFLQGAALAAANLITHIVLGEDQIVMLNRPVSYLHRLHRTAAIDRHAACFRHRHLIHIRHDDAVPPFWVPHVAGDDAKLI